MSHADTSPHDGNCHCRRCRPLERPCDCDWCRAFTDGSSVEPKVLVVDHGRLAAQQMAGYRLAALLMMADLTAMAESPCFDTFIMDDSILRMRDCAPPIIRDDTENGVKTRQWHPPEARERERVGAVSHKTKAKNRAARKAAKQARKKNR